FRGGYTFPFHLYLGGDLTIYFGNDLTVFNIGPEVGYDIGVGHNFVIRPYGGIAFADDTNGGVSFAEFYPGCEFLAFVHRGLFLGGDVRTPLFFYPGRIGGTSFGFNAMFTI